jgi:glycosyltransferase A (GT-A) superfamily protein (DUF2064 family)
MNPPMIVAMIVGISTVTAALFADIPAGTPDISTKTTDIMKISVVFAAAAQVSAAM